MKGASKSQPRISRRRLPDVEYVLRVAARR